ncbi:hypothetical protein A3K81_04935 [Candidatus Bathyarchaeota archaeon RBG_13_60_20]|nr:MAG: hypothetical protein A3K81_04935 [Candidatus Bathyarchaeota archaeon RBG_13_60_20]
MEILGSISKAAKKSGIERRTFYKMEDRDDIQTLTKEKILLLALETSQDETLKFLLKRHVDDSVELLIVKLTSLYEKAIEETDREKLVQILETFKQVNQEYQGLIKDNLETEVKDLLAHLIDKAQIEEVTWTPPRNSLYKVEELKILLPMINRELAKGKAHDAIAEQFRVPLDIVKAVQAQKMRLSRTTIEKCEGLLYSYLPRQDYWKEILEGQNTSAGITPIKYSQIATYERSEYQTSTSGATVMIKRLETHG